ncbi:MAG: DNA polymerase I [Alphaproteobacteria bacterium]|nr:DNA polymerase I [Alphaproteobacteria bacterium]
MPDTRAKTAPKVNDKKDGGDAGAIKPKHVYLIDGSGFIFRAYYAMPKLTRPDKTPVGAVLGFCNMILKLVAETDADHIAVVFDVARTTFRNRLYKDYKAHRPEPPDDLVPQFALVREATDAFSLCRIEQPDYEADDLIATYADEAVREGARVTVVSSDKDLMQLVSDKVELYDAMRDRPIRAPEVVEKFGVGPDKVADVLALWGDSSDNVPGVPGIGAKTAAELINQYGDLETLLKRASEIKQEKRRAALVEHAADARLSRKLVTLDHAVPLPCPLSDLAVRPLDPTKVTAFLQTQGFRALLARVQAKLGTTGRALPAPGQDGISSPPPLAEAKSLIPVAAATAAQLAAAKQDYELVQDVAVLDRWIAAAFAKGAVAVDTETTSLDAIAADLVGVSLALEPGVACYIPVGHTGAAPGALDLAGAGDTPKQIARDEALKRLKPLLEDSGVLKIGQNIKYDMQVFGRYGIAVGPIDCTMLMSFVLDGGLHGHGLDELAKLHFGHDMIAYKDVAGSGKNHVGFAAVPLDRARDYAAEDADFTLRLHRLLKPRLISEHRVAFYETVERPLPPVVAAMERAGITVDREELKRLSDDFAQRIAAYEVEIHKLAGHPFNVASPQQLGKVLFDELKLERFGRKTKSGAHSTDAAVLEELAEAHPLPAKVLEWRELAKLKSTYADALMQQINPATGRVHTSYSLTGAATGRLASSDPNLQNIPIRTEEGRKIRHAFIAPPGYLLISADYSQIELRLAAHVGDIGPLKEAFRQGLDIHAMTASEVFGVPIAGMDPMLRRRAKAINFGILYGISAFGLGRQIDVPHAEAAKFIKAYLDRFPGIRNYMDRTKEFARENGYVETLFGRRCYVAGIKDPIPARRGFSERAAINAPLQGAAADIIKRAMRRIPTALVEAGLQARMLLQVHDELVFEAPEREAEKTAAVAKALMENAHRPAVELSVPLVVETGMARHWDEAH